MQISKAHPIMVKAINSRNLRADIIASNISNIDTPGYKAKDILFENQLKAEVDRISGNDGMQLKLAATNYLHLQGLDDHANSNGELFLRDGHMTKNDGNSVDLDIETTEMSKNATMLQALNAALKKDSLIMKNVIDSSSRL
jgi:flagellar basal-body rod protein FlgB